MGLVSLKFPNCALRRAAANSQEHRSTMYLNNYIRQPALDTTVITAQGSSASK